MGHLYASGGFKNVFKGVYATGPAIGQPCVHKVFKSGAVYESAFFDVEMLLVKTATEIIDLWNDASFIKETIYLTQPSIWVFYPGSEYEGQRVLVEPYLSNFQKFNSSKFIIIPDTGWKHDETLDWSHIMQALSHFSYHVSNGTLILCDLQGGLLPKEGFILTDPAILSETRNAFGPTDLGPEGMETFFARHICTKYCNRDWIRPASSNVYFPEKVITK
jgi:hypothetical protein